MSPSSHSLEYDEAIDLVRARLQPALLIVIGMTMLAFTLAPQNTPSLIASRALQLCLCGLGLWGVKSPGRRAWTIPFALLVTAGLTVTTCMQIAFLESEFQAVLYLACMIIVMCAASLFPWGIPAQCVLIVVCVCAIATTLRARGVPLSSVQSDAVTALASGFAFSIYIVHAMARLRADLRANEERWRARVENAFDYIVQINPGGRIGYASPNFAHLGYTPEDLNGRVIYNLVHPQDREEAEKAFATLSSTGVTGVVMRVARADGTFRWLEVAARTFTLSDVGQQIVSVCRDVTERKLAEQERDHLIQELDAYARTVAHDLKNPIAVIAGYVGLLEAELHDKLSEEGQGFLTATGRGCEKMTQIIDELLLLASIRKAGEVEAKALDMARVVEEACQRLVNVIDEAKAEILFPDQWPQAIGYAPWLEEVWANYISNAVKYGGSPPRIDLGADQDGDGKVHFWVHDNGQGLSEEQVGKLFEEFSRIEPTKAEGHGLGLSIVKRIVEKLGGEVRVTSQVGQGSTFGFTLAIDRRKRAVNEAELGHALDAQTTRASDG